MSLFPALSPESQLSCMRTVCRDITVGTADCLVCHLWSEAWRRLPATRCGVPLSDWWLCVSENIHVHECECVNDCCEWDFQSLKLRVCVCESTHISINVWRCFFRCSSRRRWRLETADKSNNSTIFVVYGSEIEFVLQSCSPAMSRRVTSLQRRRCFNLCTSGELELTPVSPVDPRMAAAKPINCLI